MQRENKGNMHERTQNYGANLYIQNTKNVYFNIVTSHMNLRPLV